MNKNRDFKSSSIDELFKRLFGYIPKKAGTAYEILSGIANTIVRDAIVKHNQKIKSNFCDTKYQIDGLLSSKDSSQTMIEAKDYTSRNEPVGRGDLQKMQGALTDLEVIDGIFASATGYTKDAKEYAAATYVNPRQIPIELMDIRPSTLDDEKQRIKTIPVNINARGLNFTPDCIQPIFGENARKFAHQNNLCGNPISLYTIYDKDGRAIFTVEDYAKGLNRFVDINDHNQREISGSTLMKGAYLLLGNGMLCPIDGLRYKIDIFDVNTEFSITQEGKPVLLIKSLYGPVNKLLTDEQLKKYGVAADGTIVNKQKM